MPRNLSKEEILKLTVTEAKQALLAGDLKSLKYVLTIFQQIDKVSPPITSNVKKLNAFLYLDKIRAIKQAQDSDKRYKSGENIRRLEGIPFVVKDSFEVEDMPVTLATDGINSKNCISSSSGPIVQALLNEGAIIIGKANMSEDGFMLHGANNNFAGVARNPHNKEYITGGSSSGPAAAVAARLLPMSFGNDFAGSIRWPASCNGILGYRPTQNRWSNLGTSLGVAGNLSDAIQAGSFTRSAEDILLLDSVITGDNSVVQVVPANLRIGIPREYFYDNIDPQIQAAIDNFIARLSASGVTIVEANMGSAFILSQIDLAGALIGSYQLFSGPNPSVQAQYDTWAADPNNPFEPTTLAEVKAQLKSPDVISIFAALATLPTDPGSLAFAETIRAQCILLANTYMDANNLDAILIPTSAILTPLNPDPTQFSGINTLKGGFVPFTKLPCVNVPVGVDTNGLPMGADLVTRSNEDRKLLSIVKALKNHCVQIPAPALE